MSIESLNDIRSRLLQIVTERREFVEQCKRDVKAARAKALRTLKAARAELRTAEKLLKAWKVDAPKTKPATPAAQPVAHHPLAPSAADREVRQAIVAVVKREGSVPTSLLWSTLGSKGYSDPAARRRVLDGLVADKIIDVRGNTAAKRVALVATL